MVRRDAKAPPDDEPPDRKPFLLRLPPDLMEELREWANQDLRSLNAHIEFLLRDAVKRRKGRKAT
ncbi:MAG: Arc family DNA-binding protein [Planctomycetota bacterium]